MLCKKSPSNFPNLWLVINDTPDLSNFQTGLISGGGSDIDSGVDVGIFCGFGGPIKDPSNAQANLNFLTNPNVGAHFKALII